MKNALLFQFLVTIAAAAIVLTDWWGRRKDRRSNRASH